MVLSDFGARWRGFWAKHDPDELFSYDTLKLVTIRDRYLGMFHHSLQFGILIYIIVYVIFVSKQFLKLEPNVGLVRLGVSGGGNQIDPGASSYCDVPPQNTGKIPCVFPPLDQIAETIGSSLFITTRYNRTDYYATCNPDLPTCLPQTNGSREFLIGNLMSINISIDHASSNANFEGQAPMGHLQVIENPGAEIAKWKNCKQCKPNTFRTLSSDSIPLSTLLEAARVNLSEIANEYLEGTAEYHGPEDYRSFGAVILFSVVYDNQEHYFRGNPPIIYYYQPRLITDINDFMTNSIYTAFPNNRTVLYRKGIHLIGLMAGEIGTFTFQTLLVQLTTSLALLKIATTAVDLIAINILPAKILYRKAKYEKTDDFSDLKRAHERERVSKSNSFPMDALSSEASRDNMSAGIGTPGAGNPAISEDIESVR